MTKRFVWIGMLTLALIVLAACAGGANQGTRSFTKADSGQSISLKNGETFTLTLEANPTTGFTWEVSPDSTAPVALQGEPAYKADTPVAVGSGGQMTLTFKATATGQGLLKLVYHQPWEQGAPPADTFEVNVTVQ